LLLVTCRVESSWVKQHTTTKVAYCPHERAACVTES